MSADPEHFPLLHAAARNKERLAGALAEITRGTETGSIRKTVLDDAKSTLSNAVRAAWETSVENVFFSFGKWESQPKEVNDLYWDIHMWGLRDVMSASRKLSKAKLQGDAMDAMRAFVNEVLPLAQAVDELKNKVVKGRALSSKPPAPVNPNKVVKTCACCFRPIAVQSGTMAHHGYERPGDGWQTASCAGIRFKPLEVSSEGLEWLISTLQSNLDVLKETYQHRDDKTSLIKLDRRTKQMVEITRDQPQWKREFEHYVGTLRYKIDGLEQKLPELEKRLQEWKPECEQESVPRGEMAQNNSEI